jgi:hypothetical protein
MGMITNEVSKTTDVSITIGADAPTSNYFSVASVGGLVGRNNAEIAEGGFLISNAKATGNILISSENTAFLGVESIGGAVGYSAHSLDNIIVNNDITITADGLENIGGVVGYARGLSISNSSYNGDIEITAVEGITRVGGIAGYMRARYSTISDSSSAGTITLVAPFVDNIGGAVGDANRGTNFDTVTSSVAIDATNVDEGENIGGLVGYNYVTLDDDDTQFGTISNSFATGAITAPNIINVGGLVGYIEVDDSNADSVTLSHATGTVLGDQRVGGLVGLIDGEATSISDSYSQGSVTGLNDRTGGLIGYNNQANIRDSYSEGTVTGYYYNTGGLIGYNNGGTIANSYASGDVTSTGGVYVGGLVGYNDGDDYDALIIDSYATGDVSGERQVGGLVGYNWAGDADGTISNSYATGAVSGDYYIGGLVGGNENYSSGDAVIENSYATGAVSGIRQVGGLVGGNSFWG